LPRSPSIFFVPPLFPLDLSLPSQWVLEDLWASVDVPSCRPCRRDRNRLDKIRRGFCGRVFSSSWDRGGRSLFRSVDMGGVWSWGQCGGIDIHLDNWVSMTY
jgi:hypothetical protein